MKSRKQKIKATKATKKNKKEIENNWEFDLYVAGQTSETITTISNLKKICQNLNSSYKINVVDLLKNPHLAKEMQIFAIPTTIRKYPEPTQRFVGNFSDLDNIITKFGRKKDD